MPKQINKMYAFIAIDDDGDEGIVACYQHSVWLPLVGADMDRVNSLKTVAQQIANENNKKIEVIVFDNRKSIETILPEK